MRTETKLPPVLDSRAQHAWRKIGRRVGGVKKRQQFNFVGTGFCTALALLVAAFLGFSAADILFKLEVGTRVGALAITLAGALAAVFWRVVRPWRRLGSLVQVARVVERSQPQMEEQLSTALEFGDSPALTTQHSSPALVNALVQQVAERAETVDFSRTVRWKALALAGLAAFALTAVLAVYAEWQPRLFKRTLARFVQPTAAIAPPTLTLISEVLPGDRELPVESNVPVEIAVEGRAPESATLSVRSGANGEGHWEDRPMERGEDGRYRATLRRLLDTTRYKITAGDDESREYRIDVYRIPEISEFVLRLEYPAYTGRSPETLTPGVGDVRALRGTTVRVELKANTELTGGEVRFKSGRTALPLTLDGTDKRKASASFKIEKDDEYQLQVNNAKSSGAGALYSLKALKDRYPHVVIRQPDKDLMVHRDQTLTIEIVADDDLGVGEIGLMHSLGVDETKTLVRRFDPAPARAEGKLVWDLSQKGLKGGEIIAYYAYCYDNDTLGGPKLSKSEIHFLTIYDEEDYDTPQDPQHKKQGTPPAVKELDKLIDLQKKLLKDTFAQARARDAAREDKSADAHEADAAKAAAQKTAEAQQNLREHVQELAAKVQEELARAPQAEAPAPPDKPAFGEKELKHMQAATEKMADAEKRLKVPDATAAVQPETEALRHLSETRRLVLSDKEGDPRFRMAMNKQSKKRKQQEREQARQDEQQAREELAEMPKLLEREKRTERDLQELSDKRRQNPPAAHPNSEQQKAQDEQRQLQRQTQDELDHMAKEADARAQKLEQLAARNPAMRSAAEELAQAANKLQDAAKKSATGGEKNAGEAQEKTRQAQNDTRDAQHGLRDALENQARQELANLNRDAQDLAQRQEDLQRQIQQAASQQSQSQAKQASQQRNALQQAQGQQPQGQEKGGQKSSQPAGETQSESAAQRMKAMAGAQRDLQSELSDLSERAQRLAEKASEKNMAGAQSLAQAGQQSREDSVAQGAMQNAQQALREANPSAAAREAEQASKALEKLARSTQSAVQQTATGDMKALAGAMKKLQALAQQQDEIGKDLDHKRDPGTLGLREDKIAEGAKDLAGQTENLEALKQTGRDATAKEKLEESARHAARAAEALKGQDAVAAKSPVDKTAKSLQSALEELERAAGKSLEEKARETKELARGAREQQEQAAEALRQMPETPPGKPLDNASTAQRDDAKAHEQNAAREARKLAQSLAGLEQLARESNPAAAMAAREAHETVEKADLPNAMDELARNIEKLGAQEKPADKTPTPQDNAKQGDELAQTVRKAEKNLDNYIAEAVGSQLDRLRLMEQASRDAAQQSRQLAAGKPTASNGTQQPAAQPEKNPETPRPDGKNDADKMKAAIDDLQNKLERMQPRMERLEPNAPEREELKQAMTELANAREEFGRQQGKPQPGEALYGGPAFQRTHKALEQMTSGLAGRIERLLRARDIRPEEDEDAPKEYRPLVDKYYRALSEDVGTEEK